MMTVSTDEQQLMRQQAFLAACGLPPELAQTVAEKQVERVKSIRRLARERRQAENRAISQDDASTSDST
eukprot:11386839-Karenia_brevis.AAC.1